MGSAKRPVQEALWKLYEGWKSPSLYAQSEVCRSNSFSATVWQEVPSDLEGFAIWQKDPKAAGAVTPDAMRTVAKVVATYRGVKYTGIGFATLNKKAGDIWDAAYGADMAILKAIANIARQVAFEKPPALVMHKAV